METPYLPKYLPHGCWNESARDGELYPLPIGDVVFREGTGDLSNLVIED